MSPTPVGTGVNDPYVSRDSSARQAGGVQCRFSGHLYAAVLDLPYCDRHHWVSGRLRRGIHFHGAVDEPDYQPRNAGSERARADVEQRQRAAGSGDQCALRRPRTLAIDWHNLKQDYLT